MQLCSDSFGRKRCFFFFLWLFHNLLAQICCCHTLCLSGSLGPIAISMCLACHLNDPRKWLLWKAAECKMDFSLCSLGRLLAQGFSAAGGGAGRPELQLDLVARSFLVFIKILWLSFGIAPLAVTMRWSWLCCSLSLTHPSNHSGPEDKRKLKVGNKQAKGSCSAVFVEGTPVYHSRAWILRSYL